MLNIIYSNTNIDIFKATDKQKIIVVPELFSHNYERYLCEVLGNQATITTEVSSFKRIANKIFCEIGGLSHTYISESGRILALFNAISNVYDELKIFKNNKSDNLNKILAIIDEFKMYDISENDLLSSAKELTGNLKSKIYDLMFIYAEYNKITSKDLKDPRYEMDYLIENFNKCNILDNCELIFAEFDGFTPKQYNLIREMLKKGIEITVILDVRDNEDKVYDLFCVARETGQRLKSMCKIHSFVYTESENFEEESDFCKTSREIFEPASRAVEKNDNISLHISETAQRECMQIASKIVSLVRDSGYRYKDIIVTGRGFESYKNYLKIAFNRYNIPLFIADTEKISNMLPVKIIKQSLLIISENYKKESVFSLLKSEMSHFDKSDCDILEEYVNRWDINYLTKSVNFTSNPSFKLKKMTDEEQKTLEDIKKLKKIALAPIYKLEDELEKCKIGSEFIKVLYEFLENIHLKDNIYQSIEKSDNNLKKQRLSQIWEVLLDSIDQFYEISENQQMTLKEFINLYTLILDTFEIATIPSAVDNVYGGEFEKISSEQCKILFVLGCDSNNLPSKVSENAILSDFERETLELSDIHLAPFGSNLVEREHALIYKIFSKPSDKLFLSLSEISTGGDINSPSKVFDFYRNKTNDFNTDSKINYSFMYNSKKTYMEQLALQKNVKSNAEFKEIIEKSKKTYDVLQKETLEKIYTNKISPSRLDSFNSCKFMYFLRFGLKLSDKKIIKFDNLQNGNFIHFVLENVLKKKEYDIDFSSDKLNDIIEHYTSEFFSENLLNDDRFLYAFNNLKKNTSKIVKNVIDEINASDFVPSDFELEISEKSVVKPLKISDVSIVGKVDRVDILKQDDNIYLRVVDYKSGVKKLDLSTFNHGINMQMMIYMMILHSNEFYERQGKNISPKGILYIPTKYPKISLSDAIYDVERENEINSSLRRSGLLTNEREIIEKMEKNNPFLYLPVSFTKKGDVSKTSSVATEEQFAALESFVFEKIKDSINSIKNGEIYANPYTYNDRSPCDYCDFTKSCVFCVDYDSKRKFENVSNTKFFENLCGEGDLDE